MLLTTVVESPNCSLGYTVTSTVPFVYSFTRSAKSWKDFPSKLSAATFVAKDNFTTSPLAAVFEAACVVPPAAAVVAGVEEPPDEHPPSIVATIPAASTIANVFFMCNPPVFFGYVNLIYFSLHLPTDLLPHRRSLTRR